MIADASAARPNSRAVPGSAVYVSTERRYLRTADGVFVEGVEDYGFFQRYLHVFGRVTVIARVREVARLPDGEYHRADGPGVSYHALPDFGGLRGLARRGWRALRSIDRGTAGSGASVVVRAPGPVGFMTWLVMRRRRRPFGVELVTDPAEAFERRSFGSPAAALIRKVSLWAVRKQADTAACVAYVTERALQARYPASTDAVFVYSSIDLDEAVLDRQKGVYERLAGQPEVLAPGTLVFVGNLSRPFKGLDILLEALAAVRSRGRVPMPRLQVVGDGHLRESYAAQAERLGIAEHIVFLGHRAPGEAVYDILAGADMLVLPSRREGLPRVIIEGMAVGLPCISTEVCGAEELLDRDAIVPREDAVALAAKIEEFIASRDRRLDAARRNRQHSRRYTREHLQPRRNAFYHALIAAGTE